MRKLVLAVTSLGVLATLVLPVALGAGGGISIAGAPTLPIGVRVGDSYKLKRSCSGYTEFWRVKLAKGNVLRLDYGSKNAAGVEILVLAPSVTDKTVESSPVLALAQTTFKDELDFDATKAGRYTVAVRTPFLCQASLSYYVTAQIKHA